MILSNVNLEGGLKSLTEVSNVYENLLTLCSYASFSSVKLSQNSL